MSLSEAPGKGAMAADPWEAVELETFTGSPDPAGRQGDQPFRQYGGRRNDSEAFVPFYEKNGPCSARQQVEDLLREAREKAAAIEQEAYTKGFEQGEKDGFDYGRQRADTIVDQIEALLLEMGRLKHTLMEQGEKELLDIVFCIAQKVVRAQIEIDTDAVRNTIREAVGHAADQGRLTVWIHPDDAALMESIRSDVQPPFEPHPSVRIQTDPSISRGGCKVETTHGGIDATVESQMERIRSVLESVYRLEAGR